MQSVTRIRRLAVLSLAIIAIAACTGQKEPAQKLIADIEATVTAASQEASKYVPDQLADVQAKLVGLKASYDKQDYAGVVMGAPAVLAAAQSLATSAAAKKDEVLKALNTHWTALAATIPSYAVVIENRLEFLSKPANKKVAASIDIAGAKATGSEASQLWSKAKAAFATGNLDEAVSAAKDVKSKLESIAATLKVDLPAPSAAS
ncbi:MAG TPA: hypothetical protein VGI65_09485 [Steroidobacteraceae bacterium]|jgi:hypothetical protein